jgi:hypothetical protein
MDRSPRRVVDDDRLAGLWLRHVSSEYVFYAPVRLPDGALGLAQMELRTAPGDYSRHVIHWLLFDRAGLRDAGEVDRPAVAFGQALLHVERALRERGIRLDAGDQGKG